jgi:hypothetical protein
MTCVALTSRIELNLEVEGASHTAIGLEAAPSKKRLSQTTIDLDTTYRKSATINLDTTYRKSITISRSDRHILLEDQEHILLQTRVSSDPALVLFIF